MVILGARHFHFKEKGEDREQKQRTKMREKRDNVKKRYRDGSNSKREINQKRRRLNMS